jgi:hypothetical protein
VKYNEERSGPWNAGLTKNTDDRVRENGKAVAVALMGKAPTFVWTEELRQKQSERKKKLYQEFPDKHPNRKCAFNKKNMTYPERIAFEFFENNNIKFEHNPRVDKYYPDFVIDNTIIEIDGEYWHDIESDKIRDAVLESLGYTVIRIKAKERIIERLTEIYRV